MRLLNRGWFAWALVLAWPALLSAETPARIDAASLEFFESKIRPIFVENCYKCHSHDSEKIKGGLLLDSKDGLLKGGDNGPAIVPGSLEKSLLIKAVRYTDEDLQMPPKGKKLAKEQVRALEDWVKMGAPDPRTGPGASLGSSASAAKKSAHWAYQPVRAPAIPRATPQSWIKTPIDALVLTKLNEKKLKPSAPADKRSLIRRAYFDLTGLPPAPGEVEAFLEDHSADAFAKVVDHLLSRPEYGERWGRHWLDVARYADTKGYVFEEERRYAYSYTYRDYVIQAFNEDLPYDRFIIDQLAADQLVKGEDKRPLAALGFLTLGRRFLNNEPDIIDDRIDVVMRGLMGMTMGCARCHDHKFDPIPTADYYSIYGVFASSHEPAEKPLLGTIPKEHEAYLAEKEKRERALNDFKTRKEEGALHELRQRAGEYMLAAYDVQHLEDSSKAEQLARSRKLDPGVVRRWKQTLSSPEAARDRVLGPWVALTALEARDWASRGPALADFLADPTGTTNAPNPLVLKAIRESLLSVSNGVAGMNVTATNILRASTVREQIELQPEGTNSLADKDSPSPAPKALGIKRLSEAYGKLLADADTEWAELLEISKEAKKLTDADRESIRQILFADGAPPNLARGEVMRLLDAPAAQKIRALRRASEELDATHPGAPPRAMVLVDNDTPSRPHIFKRGNPSNPGDEVPRQAPAILAGAGRQPFQHGSGRLELARLIASKENPLTARVFVNRVWLLHFGSPLVRTPSDFGFRSEPPANPQLLDYLAARFMEDGWSIKKLHRLIMLSNVYQQASDENEVSARIDPINEFYWRMNRQRLDFEGLRDSLLAVSNRLDPTEGGRPVEITDNPEANRRTVYGFIDRQNLPGLMRTFDFASPDASSAQRYYTTVPQQALFMMNSPFVVLQARTLAQAIPAEAKTDGAKIRWLYERLYQRPPTRDEVRSAEAFFRNSTNAPAAAGRLWSYGYGEVSADGAKVKRFEPLPHFTSESWQGGKSLPDPKLGWVMLNAAGGHPGNDQEHDAIRRWTAPTDGSVRIEGTLSHEAEMGDGVRGRMVSSREGLVGEWIVHHEQTPTLIPAAKVRRGDTIDFVTDLRGNTDHDSFTWAPRIQYNSSKPGNPRESGPQWDAATDFAGPAAEKIKPLDLWGKYAQVLLLSNEFVFVD